MCALSQREIHHHVFIYLFSLIILIRNFSLISPKRYANVHVEGHTTGRTVLTPIPVKRPAGGTPGSTTTPARRALTFVRDTAKKVIRVSSRTAYLSAGYIRPAIVPSLVKTVLTAQGACVSSHTRLSSFGF